jgi:hypothetical protein
METCSTQRGLGARSPECLKGEEIEATLDAHQLTENRKMTRCSEYAMPTHKARMTKGYSVSLPVCSVWSQ